ncbi:GNAT family N-acetyltransferase [Mesorhizobium huakuii]|uniref:GNAT family N-acetyltransferase n=1 Tax=Mesorhizobium huakuii TaxID=28104 RepID=A0A7G6SQJ4_9HYPH|nr:GNAT family N-acetyltransferase [Mesorhizobium huakuii]QND56776.1 GNAT family N-acetyltransferase [Mesorhizobium huakuii]
MSATFTVRRATPQDEAGVSELLLASYPGLMRTAYDQAILEGALPLMTRANPALLSSGTFYLAVNGHDLAVGCGGWSRELPGSSEVTPGLAHIRHFATHPEWLRRGIGRELYRRCAEDGRSSSVRRFECQASLNAEGFYAALGFRTVRRIELRIGPGPMLPSILMERAI